MIGIAKWLLRILLRLMYRVEVHGLHHYQQAGPRALIIANHTSLLDGLLLYAWLPETPTFAINTLIASRRVFRPFLVFVNLFVMDPGSPLSLRSLIRFIRTDRKAVIFPEGRITVTGIPMKVYEGPGMVADRADASILPICIEGAQYSPLSYLAGRARIAWFPRIRIIVQPPVRLDLDPALHGLGRRRAAGRAMQRLLLHAFYSGYDYRRTVFSALVHAAHLHGGGRPVLEDVERRPLTYRQFLTRIIILARAIRADTTRGQLTGVLLPNVCAAPILFFALQYLGRVPAMLNYTQGAHALADICRDFGITAVYTSRKFVTAAALETLVAALQQHVTVHFLEDVRQRVHASDRVRGWAAAFTPARAYRRETPDAMPDNPAVVLFTSGSEGTPKGVVLSHANLLSNYAQVRCHIDFNARDTVFTCLPLFHSYGLNGGCLMPLLGGSKVFLYPTPLHYRIIPGLFYELGATILYGTNTFFRGYARHAHPYDFFSARYVVAGAEKLSDETRRQWMEKFGIRIFEGYGVTEASPVVSSNTPIYQRAGSVGQIMPGMEHYLAPVTGFERGGRLVVRGPNVMLGYLSRGPGIYADPPATERGAGWYDTGDIADIDEDGYITLLGRARRFAKVGGEMVSLAGVEELAARAWPRHAHAAMCVPDPRTGERIVLVTDNPAATRRELHEAARAQGIPELLVPKRVICTGHLPLLGTGKVDYPKIVSLLAGMEITEPD